MKAKTKALSWSLVAILMLVMLVNALAYGMVIPLLYPLAKKFGLHPLGLSGLVAIFALCQFIATPILGRLSDRFGRKWLLLLCLLGTSASLYLFAIAQSAIWLFVSRIIDGITGGNGSIAQAMLADLSSPKERTKAFGFLGAAFGLGFLLGPALGGFLAEISLSTPFYFASVLAFSGVILGALLLPETLSVKTKRVVKHEPLFNLKALYQALISPDIGVFLSINFLGVVAHFVMTIGFQTASSDIFNFSPMIIGLVFGTMGLFNVLIQSFGLKYLLALTNNKQRLIDGLLVGTVLAMLLVFAAKSPLIFVLGLITYMLAMAPIGVILTSCISERVRADDQGVMLGINQSYTSLGQVFGPLLAAPITTVSVMGTFLVAAGIFGLSLITSLSWRAPLHHKINV